MKQYAMRKKEIKELKMKIQEQLGDMLAENMGKNIIIVEADSFRVIKSDNQPLVVMLDNKILPFLGLVIDRDIGLKTVIVDKGAIKYITRGADIMKPGIVWVDHNIKKGDIVIVCEETYRKPIALAESLYDAEELRVGMGKALVNLHYIGDKIWNSFYTQG